MDPVADILVKISPKYPSQMNWMNVPLLSHLSVSIQDRLDLAERLVSWYIF
jgi:hypothetical protein